MQTKWGHIRDMIAGQLERIDTVSYEIFQTPTIKTRQDFRLKLEREHEVNEEKVRDAVNFLIRTGHWPDMTPKVQFFLKPRVMFAWKVAASLSTPLLGQPLPTFTAELEHHLAWILDDVWNKVGYGLWLLEEENEFQRELDAVNLGLKGAS